MNMLFPKGRSFTKKRETRTIGKEKSKAFYFFCDSSYSKEGERALAKVFFQLNPFPNLVLVECQQGNF